MEIRQLRSFMAVADERSFTRAAARLNIAQSPLSQQIRKLEREIGTPLFVRTTRSVALTYAGEVLYERGVQIIDLVAGATEATRRAAGGCAGVLSVGMVTSATAELLPAIVTRYAAEYPETSLNVAGDLTTPQQVERLLDGRLDVGVIRGPVEVDGLIIEPLRQEPIGLLLSADHPLAARAEIEVSELRDEWFISLPSGKPPATMYAVLQDVCATAGFAPKIKQTVSDSATLLALVAGGLGIALIPSTLRHCTTRGTEYRPLCGDHPMVCLALAYLRPQASTLVELFAGIVRCIAATSAGGQRGAA